MLSNPFNWRYFLIYQLKTTILIKTTNYNYIKLWHSWRGKTRGHRVLTMNAIYNSTKSYIINEKRQKEDKEGVLLLYFDINLTLPRLWWRKWLLLIWFCLQLYPNFDHQTRVKDKVLSDLHRQHWIHRYLRAGQRDLGAICCIEGSAGENAHCPLYQSRRHTLDLNRRSYV